MEINADEVQLDWLDATSGLLVYPVGQPEKCTGMRGPFAGAGEAEPAHAHTSHIPTTK